MNKKAFTLIEILVVVMIIGILISISIFGLLGARENARDAKRKSDLEMVRSGLELYKSDCGAYPATNIFSGSQLIGSGTPSSCAAANVYIAEMPTEALSAQSYYYVPGTGNTSYKICAALERVPNPTPGTAKTAGCACGAACNYVVISP